MQEARLLASFLAHKITPGWEVPDDVQEQWAGALSACLGKLMPGGAGNIEGWGPWGKLLYASAAWGMAGIDLQNFRMKPLQPRDPREPIEGQATRAEGAATSGGFTTGR